MSGYSSIILADTPQAYYRLDETSGTSATDSSGNSNTGTYSGAGYTLASPGCLQTDGDKGVLFTSSSGSISLPTALNANGWSGVSSECWVIPTTTGPAAGHFYILFNGPSVGNNGYQWLMNGSPTLEFFVGNGTTGKTIGVASPFVSGSKFHLVGTYDGANVKMYVNGVMVTSTAFAGGNISNSGTPTIDAASTSFFPGTIDEVAIYNYALTQTQVTKHYLAGLSGYAATVLADAPQGYYRLDENAGTNAYDASGNANTGTYAASGLTLNSPGCLRSDVDAGVLFTSSSGVITLPTALNGNGYTALTVECWFNPTTTGPSNGNFYNLVFGPNSNGLHKGYIMFLAGQAGLPTLSWQVDNGTVNVPANVSLALVPGNMYHIVGTWDGSNVRTYINGVLKGGPAALTGTITNTGNPTINTPTSSLFPGTIDEVAIYNTALTQQQITNHYNAGSCVLLASDTFFGRTVAAGGLGTTSDGNTWVSSDQSGPSQSVGSNEGVFSTASPSLFPENHLPVSAADTEVVVRASIGDTSGSNVFLQTRITNNTAANRTCYTAGFTSDTFYLRKLVNNVTTTLASTSHAFSINTFYWIRLRVVGSKQYARWWADGSAEGTTWTLTATDSSIAGSGFVAGFLSGLTTTNACKIDHLYAYQVLSPQTETASNFYTQIKGALKSQGASKFYTQIRSLVSYTRDKFYTASVLASRVRDTFLTRTPLSSSTHSKFLIPNYNIKSIARSIFRIGKHRAIKAVLRSEQEHINAKYSNNKQHINATFSGVVSMANPYTTIDVSTTVTDMNNVVVSNLSSATVTVSFPDGTTSNLTAANMGSGVYTITYTTKGPGLHKELWSLLDVSGAMASYTNIIPVTY
jgi:hypothetical protein